jgi:hypothetical protein
MSVIRNATVPVGSVLTREQYETAGGAGARDA